MPKRVLVIGAQGYLGSFIAGALSREGWRVTRGGRRPEPAADFRLVDLDREETLRGAFRDVDLVVSTVRHPRLPAERLVLREGPALVNLDDLPARERARLKEEVATPNGLVVDRCGLYGVAMLALAELLKQHCDADTVKYGFLASAQEKSGRAGMALIHRLLRGPGRHATATFHLPDPFGRRRCIEAGPEGADLLRETAGNRTTRVYLCFMPRAANRAMLALNAVGLASRLPMAALTWRLSNPPAEPSQQPTCHWVEVGRGSQRVAARFICGAGDYRMSVAVTSVVADTLASRAQSGSIENGMFGIEEIITLAQLAPALAARGITMPSQ
jgi:NAD(P)-dependent dehydrogenase (short-subunit alcohol dehydrogenase family)